MTTNDVEVLLNKIAEDMNYADVIIDSLHSMGYNNNYELAGNKLVCLQTQLYYFPRDFKVDEIYRFDVGPMQLEGYYLYALRDSSGHPAGIFTAYPVQDDVPSNRQI